MKNGPKVLFLDIETSPLLGQVWQLFDQNISLNQLEKDWFILAFATKWLGEKEITYFDSRNSKDIENDKPLLKELWKLLDEADIVVGHNSNKFDIKKINARFVLNGMKPPSSYKKIDTLVLAKKHFNFTSNKLEYLADKLNVKYKKLKHAKFQGHELWKQCLLGNMDAWAEMEKYNKNDVLALEELYDKLKPWDSTIDFNLYSDSEENVCKCGSTEFVKYGYAYLSAGKYQRYQCKSCGHETRDNTNLLSPKKKKNLRRLIK